MEGHENVLTWGTILIYVMDGKKRESPQFPNNQPGISRMQIRSASHFTLISSTSKLTNTYGTHKLITTSKVLMAVTITLHTLILLNRGCREEKAQATCSWFLYCAWKQQCCHHHGQILFTTHVQRSLVAGNYCSGHQMGNATGYFNKDHPVLTQWNLGLGWMELQSVVVHPGQHSHHEMHCATRSLSADHAQGGGILLLSQKNQENQAPGNITWCLLFEFGSSWWVQ